MAFGEEHLAQFQILKLHHQNLNRQLFEQVLIDLLEAIAVDLSGLQGAVTELQQSQTAASNELADLAQQVLSLQDAGPGNITQQQLDDLTASVHGAATALTGSVSSAQSTVGGGTPGPSPEPSPSTSGPVVSSVSPSTGSPGDEVKLSGSGFTGATSVAFGVTSAESFNIDSDASISVTVPDGDGSQGVVVTTPAGASDGSVQFSFAAPAPTPDPTPEPVVSPTPDKSVYVFDGDASTVDTSVWADSGFQTTEVPPRTLYYFSGDTTPTDTNGDGAGNNQWHLYTDEAVQDQPAPDPAPASSGEPLPSEPESPSAGSTPPQG